MPTDDRPKTRRPSRRFVLLAGASLAVAPVVASGCTRHKAHVPTPSESLLDETLALEDELVSSYDAALAAVPARSSLARLLANIRVAHLAHRDALLTAGAQPSPASTAGPNAAPPPTHDIARTLAATEAAAATVRTATCVRSPRELAPLLASLAASESAHAALLRQGA